MNVRTSPPASCPEHLDLLALAEGTLSEDRTIAISDHVAECQSCDLRLNLLEEQSDDLVRALAMLPATEEDERTFRDLQAKLLANPETFSAAGTSTEVLKANIPPSLVLPMQIGNYELLEQIGAGANGAVFRSRHCRLDKTVAVKLLLNADSASIAEFLHEMRVIGQLDHPNIIEATDAGEHEGIYFLVMEYAPGLDVSSLLRKVGPLPVAEACEVARQVALGLSVAHENNLVHRDVKTSNLLFTSSGEVKLLDLGLATISFQKTSQSDGLQSGPRGTADYMAPEQWRDAQRVNPSADVYSLGCTLYKLLTGDPPFRPLPDSSSSLEDAHVHGEVPPIRKKHGHVPSALESLIQDMLAKSPEQRPASAKVVADRLSRFASGANLERIAHQVLPDAPRKRLRSEPKPSPFPWLTRRAMIGTVALAALAFVAFLMNHNGKQVRARAETWRRLTPIAPKVIPATFIEDVQTLQDAVEIVEDDDGLLVTSPEPIVLHLGNPLSRPYRMRVALKRDDWDRPSGLAFRIRRSEQGHLQPHTIEVIQVDEKWWISWNSYENGLHEDPVTLAETSCPAQDRRRVEIEVGVGASGFPRVLIDGESLPQSTWSISTEARSFITTHPKQLAATYAGRIGIYHAAKSMQIQNTKMMYSD